MLDQESHKKLQYKLQGMTVPGRPKLTNAIVLKNLQYHVRKIDSFMLPKESVFPYRALISTLLDVNSLTDISENLSYAVLPSA